ncbi:MAG: hypothetical protein Q8Q33_01600 [Chlamydiota bacterium]|nr:hypothetical protein [Chlamydiota bacterium]
MVLIRIVYLVISLFLCLLLNKNYNIHGANLFFGCLSIGLYLCLVTTLEWWIKRKDQDALLPILFGISLGYGLASFVISTLQTNSILGPALEGLPWQILIFSLFIYLSIVFLIKSSQEMTNIPQINFKESAPHHPLITLLRIGTYGFALILIIYALLEVKTLDLGINIWNLPAKGMAQLDRQGYDFDVTHSQGGQIKLLGLTFVMVCIFILEWIFRKSSSRLFFVMIPWLLSTTCLLAISQKLLNLFAMPSWIPIDLAQAFTILSIFYFTTTLSWHAFSLKVLHYPLIRITFSHEE